MKLKFLGFTKDLEEYCSEQGIDLESVGRVTKEHRGLYVVKASANEYEAKVRGKLMHIADGRASFPAVGDWVELIVLDNSKAIIKSIMPRTSAIERQAVGNSGQKQIIASNVDFGFIVQAVDRDFNINRLERYLTICRTTNIKPIIILNKTDLISTEALEDLLDDTKKRIKNVPIIAISNESQFGIYSIESMIEDGKTYCLLGSSGVGKSTLINNLIGSNKMQTGNIGSKTNKGKHVTSHRELVVLSGGGIIIDNPGMREVGVSDDTSGLKSTFTDIASLGSQCKFNDCKHIKEKGCAVLSAINEGTVSKDEHNNYMKMQREITHYESTIAQRRQKDKAFGKMVKNAKNSKHQRGYN